MRVVASELLEEWALESALLVSKAEARVAISRPIRETAPHIAEPPPEEVIFGGSPTMQTVRRKVQKAAVANVPVLLQGESGTGKDILARTIHLRSIWSGGPFVRVSCPAIPGTLLESELFGYERGAFTGAYGTKPGRVEMANRGTLFLDEIGEMDSSLQAKLLQVLQDGQFCPIGGKEDRRIEVRVICATNRNLEEEIEAGRFRRDLFYRINVLNIRLPSLHERAGDIPALVNYFLASYQELYQIPCEPLPPSVLRQMQAYKWPGNIRELENLARRYVILGSDATVISEALRRSMKFPETENKSSVPSSLKEIVRQAGQDLERKIIQRALEANGWNRRKTARQLQISYRTLLYKLKDAGISPSTSAEERPETEKVEN